MDKAKTNALHNQPLTAIASEPALGSNTCKTRSRPALCERERELNDDNRGIIYTVTQYLGQGSECGTITMPTNVLDTIFMTSTLCTQILKQDNLYTYTEAHQTVEQPAQRPRFSHKILQLRQAPDTMCTHVDLDEGIIVYVCVI